MGGGGEGRGSRQGERNGEGGREECSQASPVVHAGGVEVQAKCSGLESLALMTAAVDVAEKLTTR